MTCVWDSIIAGIHNDIFAPFFPKKPTPLQFVEFLKSKNKKTNIKVNDIELTEKEKEENFEAISIFNQNNIGGGYDCSTCDPFMLLICEIFQCSITHKYLNVDIKYETENPKFRIYVYSSRGHMSLICQR